MSVGVCQVPGAIWRGGRGGGTGGGGQRGRGVGAQAEAQAIFLRGVELGLAARFRACWCWHGVSYIGSMVMAWCPKLFLKVQVLGLFAKLSALSMKEQCLENSLLLFGHHGVALVALS